ncbi:MAG: hypothetical protein EBS98_08720 [Chitinophagia bacterium]|nr:hypothetical protein [Chitinophagia bacterium]
MNPKLQSDIENFVTNVGNYIIMEYESFYDFFKQSDMFDFIGSYYLGGSSVPDTARYVVELILMQLRDK